jgi:hypothetical protein
MQFHINKEAFQAQLAKTEITRLDKLLLVLFWDIEKPKSSKKIQEIASENGLKECKKWNISDILSKSKGKAISIKEGWILTSAGQTYLFNQKLVSEKKNLLKNEANDLRLLLSAIKNSKTRDFLEEAIVCLEADQKRAAAVFSWIGAISLLYDHVIINHLALFNSEALKRDSKWKTAKNADDLTKMKEFEFLNILETISVIGKNVKQELQQCLQLRNSCGHPNSLKIGPRKVAAHIESLILNVFSKY